MAPTVTFITRAGCHLCDEAHAVVSTVAAELNERGRVQATNEASTRFAKPLIPLIVIEERSIDDDPQLHEKYCEKIPVVLIDGQFHAQWRVNPEAFKKALQAV